MYMLQTSSLYVKDTEVKMMIYVDNPITFHVPTSSDSSLTKYVQLTMYHALIGPISSKISSLKFHSACF